MNILVFGKDGQLGKAFQRQLLQPLFRLNHNVCFVGRNECDLRNLDQINKLLNGFLPDLIINAAAYTAVDQAELESELAFAINAFAPEVMAKYSAEVGATLLHFSTDYVFDGFKIDPYCETDITNPLGVYGKSKETGEQAIVNAFAGASVGQYAIVRTSWVYGEGNNFIHKILNVAKNQSELRVVNDQFGVPTSAIWLANVGILLVMSGGLIRQFSSGIFHAVPCGKTNWYELACLVIETATKSGAVFKTSSLNVEPISASCYQGLAMRPLNSCMSTKKLQEAFDLYGLLPKISRLNESWEKRVVQYVRHLLIGY